MRNTSLLLASVGIIAFCAPAQALSQARNASADPQVSTAANDTPASAAQAPSGPVGPVAAPVQESTDSAPGQEIVVTASRIDRAGFTAPTPTTVIGVATLEQRASVNVANVLNEVPSFRRSQAPEGGGIGNSGANNVDLRGLTPVRTLVLLDRMRLPGVTIPGQTIAGVPDLNIIPTALISKIDVVTGGASAAYGSDAVAGVVNLQLNTHLQGINLTESRKRLRGGFAERLVVIGCRFTAMDGHHGERGR